MEPQLDWRHGNADANGKPSTVIMFDQAIDFAGVSETDSSPSAFFC